MPALSEIKKSSAGRPVSRVNSPFVLLETLARDKENKDSFLFSDFKEILTFNPGDNINLFFNKMETYLDKGYWLAGYFTYEFGYFLEPALSSFKPRSKGALAWIGVCSGPVIEGANSRFRLYPPACAHQGMPARVRGRGKDKEKVEDGIVKNLRAGISKKDYVKQIKKIKHYLEEGLSYQVNFTFKMKFDFAGSPFGLYLKLKSRQPTVYTAFIDTGKEAILSFSPELFFRVEKEKIIARPMKGTIKRGATLAQDKRFKDKLRRGGKTQAENLMIVDLLRNDLGRISNKVNVPEFFKVEKYPTLFQMTSTIEAKLRDNLKIKDIFTSLFPCGSVTGAPKIKTMEIIKELEKEPRGVYTGAIGYISPRRKACFSVGIRTACIRGRKGELGVGGGIVYDSKPADEYSEALLKAKFFKEGIEKV